MNDQQLDIEDAAALLAYLRDRGRIAPDETPKTTTLAGGVSNRTVLLERDGGEAWVLKQALPKLRVAVDWESDPRRIEREALGMQWLARLAPAGTITPLVFLDPSVHLLAMAAVPQPHDNWKALLLAGRLEPHHVSQFATLLAYLHRNGWEHRSTLSREFADRSFFESLRLEPYYLYAAQQAPAAAPFLARLVAQTRATQQTLVHGDYSPKNILVHRDRLILLDHEVIHFGDGAFDVGFSLTHLLSKAHRFPGLRQRFAQAARYYWAEYRRALGDAEWSGDLEARAVSHSLGCLLARCAGRSPLEYLDAIQRQRQAQVAVGLMTNAPPAGIGAMIDAFIAGIARS